MLGDPTLTLQQGKSRMVIAGEHIDERAFIALGKGDGRIDVALRSRKAALRAAGIAECDMRKRLHRTFGAIELI
ncbi:MAG: hypothetical protein U5L11_07385 [Arhodomonas sp.]|nr:hypothetical protein [Arhodomonas sp.]